MGIKIKLRKTSNNTSIINVSNNIFVSVQRLEDKTFSCKFPKRILKCWLSVYWKPPCPLQHAIITFYLCYRAQSAVYVARGLNLLFHHGRTPLTFTCCKVSLSDYFLRLNTSPVITSRDSIFSDVIMDCQSDTGTHLFCMQTTKKS